MKPKDSSLELIDIIKLADRLVTEMSAQAWQGSRVLIVLDAPRPEIWVMADETRLRYAIIHLLHNAVRHTPPGGVVILSISKRLNGVYIKVQDSGEGIHPDQLSSIWGPSVHGNDQVSGMGLGLTVVKKFIEAMQGKITVTSMPGEGACFTIILPRPRHRKMR